MLSTMSQGQDNSDYDDIEEVKKSFDSRANQLKKHTRQVDGTRAREDELLELAYGEQIQNLKRTKLIDKAYEGKGFLHYWYVKMPAKVLNIGSISDSQRVINDSIRAMTSPLCPMCSQGILMYNLDLKPVEGKVRWFCANEKHCNFKIWAPPSSTGLVMTGVEDVIAESMREVGRERWLALTEEEKQELIKSHLETARIYRLMAMLVAILLLAALITQMWWGVSMVVGLLLLSIGLSIKWCFNAWKIKTGNVYMPEPVFWDWLKTADKYYSVDWVDNPKALE